MWQYSPRNCFFELNNIVYSMTLPAAVCMGSEHKRSERIGHGPTNEVTSLLELLLGPVIQHQTRQTVAFYLQVRISDEQST